MRTSHWFTIFLVFGLLAFIPVVAGTFSPPPHFFNSVVHAQDADGGDSGSGTGEAESGTEAGVGGNPANGQKGHESETIGSSCLPLDSQGNYIQYPNAGHACFVPNSCGQQQQGYYDTCGVCQVSAPRSCSCHDEQRACKGKGETGSQTWRVCDDGTQTLTANTCKVDIPTQCTTSAIPCPSGYSGGPVIWQQCPGQTYPGTLQSGQCVPQPTSCTPGAGTGISCAAYGSCGDANYGEEICNQQGNGTYCSANPPAPRTCETPVNTSTGTNTTGGSSGSGSGSGSSNTGTNTTGSNTNSTYNAGAFCSSDANSCGATTEGFIDDQGNCSATTPPESECAPPAVVCTPGTCVSPLITEGNTCTIAWSATPSTKCTITGPNLAPGLTFTPTASRTTTGSVLIPKLLNTAVYTISCQNGTLKHTEETFTCRLSPKWREI